MAKTLKFALSALALVNAHKPRDDVQAAYDQFLKDFGKSYDSIEKQVLEGLDGVQRGWGSMMVMVSRPGLANQPSSTIHMAKMAA